MALNRSYEVPGAETYSGAEPFPHVVMQGLWDDAFLSRVGRAVEGFDDWDGEKSFAGAVGKRWCSTWEKLPRPVARLISAASRPAFLKMLETMTGEAGLVPDPYLAGAGIHSTGSGGFLKLHADFTWHGDLRLYRRLNLLIYLNRDWREDWGGALELAARGEDGALDVVRRVPPLFNTSVLFTTDDRSFHGQPEPMVLPEGVTRNSIALYYYVAEKPAGVAAAGRTRTVYRAPTGKRLRQSEPA